MLVFNSRRYVQQMNTESKTRIKSTIIYLGIIIIAAIAGIESRNYPDYIPAPISKYFGDTMWAFALFFLLCIFFPEKSVLSRVLITLVISTFIELSQLFHSGWIDAIRNTTIGGLILGYGFHWADILCYFTGAILAVAVETLIIDRLKI